VFAPAQATELQPKRGIFDGLRLKVSPLLEQPGPSPLERAVTRFGRAAQDIIRIKEQGYDPLIHQRKAFGVAIKDLDALHPGGGEDMRIAMNKNPALIGEAANGRTTLAIQAMIVEGEIRIDANNRADRFVADWQHKSRQIQAFERQRDYAGVTSVKADMGNMAQALQRDPQLESLLRNRTHELGLKSQQVSSISHGLQEWLGHSRGLGISM
jgi:hypothetical protein